MPLGERQQLKMSGEQGGQGGRGGIFIRTSHLLLITLAAIAVIVAVGLMCFYLPDRDYDAVKSTNMPTTGKLPTMPPGPWPGRLPTDVIPESYELFLRPYINDEDLADAPGRRRFTFDGRVNISLVCAKPTSRITLHYLNMTVLSVSVYDDERGNDILDKWETEDEYQFLHADVTDELVVGKTYTLRAEYIGELNDGLSGFYRSSYTQADGHTSWFATTQMQPTDARRALPCFDETDFRAVFNVTIEHRNHMAALSNGIELETIDLGNGWNRTVFKPTPPMSTYLLAFVVGEFNFLENITTNGVRFRTWSRPDVVQNTAYALEIGAKIITYFESYFNISFPLEKQDMIAVPDLSFGAMENWGLITYRETRLLYDPRVHSASNKQIVAIVIAHELAHQWFGNLVTPEWWDDLWLNEGFATYITYLGVDYVEPDWGMLGQFLTRDLHIALGLDSLGSSHPIRVPVGSPAEINEIFDTISYSKGGSVLRMLNNFLTESVFTRGLHEYLTEFRFGNAVSDDLWKKLTEADASHGGLDVKAIMDTWTLQMGYPVVTVERQDRTRVVATQQHYLSDPAADLDTKYGDLGYLWWIFIQFTHRSEGNFLTPASVWMEGTRTIDFQLEASVADEDWYLVNTYQYGYYRVNYDQENWITLTAQLNTNHSSIPVENRAQLIDDAFDLASTGNLSHVVALNLSRYLRSERDYIPWKAALVYMNYIASMLRRSDGYGELEMYMRDLLTSVYNSFGWSDSENVLEQFTRNNVIEQACFYNLDDCVNKATALFKNYMASPEAPNAISNNLKIQVYCTALRHGGQEEWNFGWMTFANTDDAFEREKWLVALGCSQEPWILNRYLRLAIDEGSAIRTSEVQTVLRSVANNHVGGPLVWEFFRNNWDRIFDVYGEGLLFAKMLTEISSNFNNQQELKELLAFGEGRDFGSATRAYEQAIEKTRTNIQWMENYEETISTWLRQNRPN